MQLMELASHAIALDTKGMKARRPREEVVGLRVVFAMNACCFCDYTF